MPTPQMSGWPRPSYGAPLVVGFRAAAVRVNSFEPSLISLGVPNFSG